MTNDQTGCVLANLNKKISVQLVEINSEPNMQILFVWFMLGKS